LTTSVSDKTDFVVIGYQLEDGRDIKSGSKYITAVENNIPIITESEILSRIQSSNPNNIAVDWNAVSSVKETVNLSNQSQSTNKNDFSTESTSVTSTNKGASVSLESKAILEESLWVEKYKPQRLNDIVGSSGKVTMILILSIIQTYLLLTCVYSKDTIKKLIDWLERWNDVHIKKSLK
jgi:hypothetical protein